MRVVKCCNGKGQRADREVECVCCSEQVNILCGQNVEWLNVELAVHIVTTGL
jgi:hypothetical protein